MKYIIALIILIIPFNVGATSTIAYEMNSNKILYSSNIHDQRSVASISKIMTAILAIESGKLNDMVLIGDEINKAYGSGIYIQKDEKMLLKDLVYGLMLRSGNDASFAIAKYVGGSVEDFVSLMNKKAQEIGMKNTIFNNPNGLEDKGGNKSTAYDMALLTTYAMKNEDYKEITKTKKHVVKTNKNYYSWVNKNKLLFNYKYTTGGKTGFTEVAKRTLVTTASNNNLDIVIVTLNDGNDFNNHKYLYEQLFNEYKGYNILKKGDISILNLTDDKQYYVKNDYIYPLKDTEKENIRLKFELENKEYKNNDQIGKVKIYLGDDKIGEENVYVSIEEKVTFWQKIVNKMKGKKDD